MRIMCDTNVLVRAALSPGGAASELMRMIALDHALITSSAQFAELLDVLRRPAIVALHKLGERGIRRYISRIFKLARVVTLPAEIPLIVAHDPKDNPIVMTAISGNAEFLYTLDRHLRTAQVIEYCRTYGVEIISDADLLARLRASSPQ